MFALDAADHLTPDTIGYVTIATGSRPPGITTVEFTAQQLSSFPGESMTSYEVGLKNEFFDHRLRLNVGGFYMDYSKRPACQTQYQCLSGPNAGPPPKLKVNFEGGSLTPWLDGVAALASRVSSVKIFAGSCIGRD
jgi:TonB dependent receptor